eukprot:13637589-Ditylum_brightwellii.AAC.1
MESTAKELEENIGRLKIYFFFQKPTHVYRLDSCPWGLGGYSHEGWAWRFYIPDRLQFRASNNVLEYIAAVITPWIDIIAGRLRRGNCALLMTDSSTFEGWLKKSNFTELTDDPIQATMKLEVCKSQLMCIMKNGIKDYSQWCPGKDNDVSDALSQDDNWEDEEITHILKTFVPSQ